jgi:uncharacterized protein YggT (Ycf19 family)
MIVLGKHQEQQPSNSNQGRVTANSYTLSSLFDPILRLLHTMNVRFSLLDIAQRILGVPLPNFQ